MRLLHSIKNLHPLATDCGLTIGTFDGMHLGHQDLFQKLRSYIGPSATLAVVTFSNHPADVLPNRSKTLRLSSTEHKIELMEQAGADLIILLEFTPELAQQPYQEFLLNFHQKLHFSHLLLGEGASFGKNRAGTPSNVSRFASSLNFSATYFPKKEIQGIPISSGKIRALIEEGNLSTAANLLGRPYSLFGQVKACRLERAGRCLPPAGRYPLLIKNKDMSISGWGQVDQGLTLECKENLSGCTIEAIFI